MAEEKNPFADISYPDEVGPPMKDAHFLRGSTAMHKASALLDMAEVEKLLAAGDSDVDTGDVLNQTPLILLARNHYDPPDVPKAVAMINKLISVGATLTVEGKIRRDQYGDSLLHLAAMASGKNGPDILKALIAALPPADRGQLCSARCKNFGNTAVRRAARLRPSSAPARDPSSPHTYTSLLWAHPPARPPRAQLHWATLGGDADSCMTLLDAGARLDRKNRLKETIVDYAVKYEHVKLKVKYEPLIGK